MTIYHKHHIIPRHMGGTDDPSNLIELTIEEHAEAHRLLYEQHGRWQDKLAWQGLSGMIDQSEIIRQKQSEASRMAASQRGPMSEEQKAKISATLKGRPISEEARLNRTGKKRGPFSEEHRRNMSKARTGKKRKPFSEEARRNMSTGQQKRRLAEVKTTVSP